MRLTFKRDESGKVQEYVLKIYLNTQMTYLLALLGKGCLHLQTPRTQWSSLSPGSRCWGWDLPPPCGTPHHPFWQTHQKWPLKQEDLRRFIIWLTTETEIWNELKQDLNCSLTLLPNSWPKWILMWEKLSINFLFFLILCYLYLFREHISCVVNCNKHS